MTPFMLDYASLDVASLFELRMKLLAKSAILSTAETDKLNKANTAAPTEFSSKSCHEVVFVPENKIGCVIGKGGSGIANIERRTGAFVTGKNGGGFLILAANEKELANAKSAIKNS
jgi:polyribonucleotide nucleotidyltransferase